MRLYEFRNVQLVVKQQAAYITVEANDDVEAISRLVNRDWFDSDGYENETVENVKLIGEWVEVIMDEDDNVIEERKIKENFQIK